MILKKILFTGGTGFLGRNLVPVLQERYEVYAPTREALNLTDAQSIDSYFEGKYFDVIIHAAIPNLASGADCADSLLKDSLYVFEKIASKKDSYGKMIYFGSGAEFDKAHDIAMVREDDFGVRVPENDYGFAKYMMNKICRQSDNLYNLRIFGCYGPTDAGFKLITSVIRQCIANEDIILNQNCYFDFMYVKDIAYILDYFINHTPKHHDYNMCTGIRTEIVSIAQMIKDKMQAKGNIIVKKGGLNKEYTADNSRICQEIKGLSFTSLSDGIDIMINAEMEYIDNEKKSC